MSTSPLPPVPAGRQEIDVDVDVLFGAVPSRRLDASLDAAAGLHARHRIRRGLVCSLRAALFDARGSNDEMLKAGDRTGFVPVGAVDVRDALAAEAEIGRLAAAGVRPLRLFPPEQWVEPDSAGLAHVVDLAVAHEMVLLTGGDFGRFWRPFAGRGARVCFLDVHAYRVADFVLLARRELHGPVHPHGDDLGRAGLRERARRANRGNGAADGQPRRRPAGHQGARQPGCTQVTAKVTTTHLGGNPGTVGGAGPGSHRQDRRDRVGTEPHFGDDAPVRRAELSVPAARELTRVQCG